MKLIATLAALAVTTLGLLAKEKEAAVPDVDRLEVDQVADGPGDDRLDERTGPGPVGEP